MYMYTCTVILKSSAKLFLQKNIFINFMLHVFIANCTTVLRVNLEGINFGNWWILILANWWPHAIEHAYNKLKIAGVLFWQMAIKTPNLPNLIPSKITRYTVLFIINVSLFNIFYLRYMYMYMYMHK